MNEENIRVLLTEEKWTRASINTYTVPAFEEIDEILNQVENGDDLLEIKSICEEHIKKNKNSIIAMYISGVVSIMRKSLDYGHLTSLIEMFNENGKPNVVEFLSQKILDRYEDKYVLRVLAATFDKAGKEEEKYDLYKRLVAVDFEETDLLLTIARRYIEKNKKKEAIVYYKKAFQRYLNVQNFQAVQEVWSLMLTLIPEDFTYLLGLATKIINRFNGEGAIKALTQLYQLSIEKDQLDQAITTLKLMLNTEPNNTWAREQLVSMYKNKYAKHSRLNSCIDLSNLDKSFRDVLLAIDEFEKNIAFDKGSFVYHKTWSIGRIRDITHESVVIDFPSRRNHSMSLSMAFSSLQVLEKHHIWVLKSVFSKEKLHDKFISDVAWGLRTLIISNKNAASLKEMKGEITPSILTAKEWTSWLNKAKKVLMTDPLIGLVPNENDIYMVRDTPISYEEKALVIFKNEKRFYAKVKIIREFLESGDVESDFFVEMVKYFRDQCVAYQGVTDQVVSSFLLVQYLSDKYPFITPPENNSFKQLYNMLDSVPRTFQAIEDTEIKKIFINQVVKTEDPERVPLVLVSLYPYYLTSYIMDTLREQGKKRVIEDMFKKACTNYRENADLFTYLSRTFDRKYWEKKIRVPFETLITSQLQLLDYAFNAVEAKKATTENKKIVKTLMTILFEERTLFDFIATTNEGQSQRINFIVQRMSGLDQSKKIEVKHAILEKFPDFTFLGEELSSTEMVSSGLLVTKKRFIEKQNELDHLMNVEIPENSREIGAALDLGDLRENSEFKAAKEKQGILNTTMMRLTDEISRAAIVNPDTVDPAKISFGTEATFTNHITHEVNVYQIFGPWESNPNENIISYLAPFGAKLLNRKVGERFSFEINETSYDFTVESIKKLKF